MCDIKIGVIGGSGLEHSFSDTAQSRSTLPQTPFGPPSGPITQTQWHDVPVALLARHGPGHLLNPSHVPYRANIFALKSLGCTHILATGAVGALRATYHPADLVVVDQIIDKTCRRESTFFDQLAVHVEMAEPFCPALRQIILDAGHDLMTDDQPITIHSGGCYVCMEGPAFSTRAESLMHRAWGGDLIGMTAMPEVKLAREAEMSYAMIALVTDYDCWKPRSSDGAPDADALTLQHQIIGNLTAASANALRLVKATIARIGKNKSAVCDAPAHSALKLAIWSDKQKFDPQLVQRFWPIWSRYFQTVPDPSSSGHD